MIALKPYRIEASIVKYLETIVGICLACASARSFAHGEGKPGPHGGTIRMTADFHVELVWREKNVAEVYLLDLEFKNPIVSKSRVVMNRPGPPSSAATCEAKTESFVCRFPAEVDLGKPGRLTVEATRRGRSGPPVEYPTPI